MDETKLNTEQQEAVHHGDGPLLIIAGAGTGKTTVVTERIKYLITEKNISPTQILALTFTEKASREMEERVDRSMPYGYTQLWISTFHSFCDRILRSEALHIGLDPSYKLTTQSEIVLFLRKNIFKFELDYFRPLGNPTKFIEGMLQHFDRLRDEDVSPQEYIDYAHALQKENTLEPDEVKKTLELAHAYDTFEKLKIQEGMMDFPNLLSATLELFRTRKNILKKYQEQFKYILIDEFQDTNFAQIQLALLLAGEIKNITVVGDDDQAIYRWRGAAISNMLQFRSHFPDAKIVTLIKNYRSTKQVLNSSYQLIQYNNPDRLEVKENINKQLDSMRKIHGSEVEFFFEERVEDEAAEVVRQIINVTNKKNGYSFSDIAILVRANDHSAPFIRALEREAIPYQFLGPGQLFLQEPIKDLLAFLKVLYNFEDSQSLYRVLCMPVFNCDAKEIATLLNFAKRNNYTLFETLEKAAETSLSLMSQQKMQLVGDVIKKHLALVAHETAGSILYHFLQDTGMLKQLSDATSKEDEQAAKYIAALFAKLKTFEAENDDASVFSVVEWIDLSMQLGESRQANDMDWMDNNAVSLLTIHASKGLEFPVVFVVNLVSQRFPTRERKEAIPIPDELIKEVLPEGDYHEQEERRLCYVAMTRARDLLFLTAAKYYGEGKREKKISPFVIEAIGKDAFEKALQKDQNQQLSLFDWTLQTPTNKPIILAPKQRERITYLSYSQLQTFDFCPLHYKLKYLLKVPESKKSAAPTFGTSLHRALQFFYQAAINGQKVTVEDVQTFLEKAWIKQGYDSKAHEKESYDRALKVLKQYITNYYEDGSLPLALETPFSFNLKRNNEWLKLAGRIDRVDMTKDGKIEIIDYKTGSNVPSDKELAKNLQLTMYALAATKIQDKIFNRKPEEIVLSLHYLDMNQKLTTTRTAEELLAAEEEIIQKVETIETSDFLCSGGFFCRACEYNMLCSVKN